MKELTLSVSQLNEYVRKSLASDPVIHNVGLMGEISNFKRHVSGHLYFTLKDEEASIACVMFRQSALTVRFQPVNGQRVRLLGSVGLYPKTGSYQFYADLMEEEGLGDLFLRFEALKAKLEREGLFDPALKKPLPLLPRGVGVITSKTGAVIHDIARVTWRRDPCMPLYLCPVSVQGERAAGEIADALALMDGFEDVDVLIVGRGGGSMEDLWAFNEEAVARAIAACHKPVISAVGHETDFTIADFAADVRAATPSAAAELATQRRDALCEAVVRFKERLEGAARGAVAERELAVAALQNRLRAQSPAEKSERARACIMDAAHRLRAGMEAALTRYENALAQATLRLSATGPTATLRRGYAIVLKQGVPVRDVKNVAVGDALSIRLCQGELEAAVTQTKPAPDHAGM